MTKSAPIGLVGIGLMGEVLAGRLLALAQKPMHVKEILCKLL